jgi:hypothetical protein
MRMERHRQAAPLVGALLKSALDSSHNTLLPTQPSLRLLAEKGNSAGSVESYHSFNCTQQVFCKKPKYLLPCLSGHV